MDLKTLERWFRDTWVIFGLRVTQFTPAGLRAGGKTHGYLCGSTGEQLMWRGRWETLSSLRHSIQEAVTTLPIAHLPPHSTLKLLESAAALRRVMTALTLACLH